MLSGTIPPLRSARARQASSYAKVHARYRSSPVCMNACAADGAGHTTRYIVHRLCPATGATNVQVCATATNTAAAGGGGSKGVGATTFAQTSMVYYRVMSRVDGPRNTASVVQSFVQISR